MMKYKVHRFDIRMTTDQTKLEQYLNNLDGEIIAIFPNVTFTPGILTSRIDFVFVVEKLVERVTSQS